MLKSYLIGPRCRPIDSIFISGVLPDANCFTLVPPLPKEIPANGMASVNVRFKPSKLGSFNAKLNVRIKDSDEFLGGQTVYPMYSSTLTGFGKDEEFFMANKTDILNFGEVCIGDTAHWEWPILNLGGCDVIIQNGSFAKNTLNQFHLDNSKAFPMTIPKEDIGNIGKAALSFTPTKQGFDTAIFIIQSVSMPLKDTLVLIGYGDSPRFNIIDKSVNYDTICPNDDNNLRIKLENPTACTVDIDSIWIKSLSAGFAIEPNQVSISPHSEIYLNVNANLAAFRKS